MSALEKQTSAEPIWVEVCASNDLPSLLGARALVEGEQIALFRVKDAIYAIDAFDPFSKAAVLSRGIVGDLKEQIVVASPIYKQHFNLQTGVCLEDSSVCLKTYSVREADGRVFIDIA